MTTGRLVMVLSRWAAVEAGLIRVAAGAGLWDNSAAGRPAAGGTPGSPQAQGDSTSTEHPLDPFRPRILVDIDNVISDSDPAFRKIFTGVTSGRVRLERADVVRYDYHENADKDGNRITVDEWHIAHEIFLRLGPPDAPEPLPGAVGGLRALAEEYDLVIATSRPAWARRATIDWLERHLGGLDYELYFPAYRGKHRMGDLAFAIEDDHEQASLFAGAGVPCYILAAPWNVDGVRCPALPGLSWYDGWAALAKDLLLAVRIVKALGGPAAALAAINGGNSP